MDGFCDAMLEIAARIEAEDNAYADAPKTLSVGRLDEVRAAKSLNCSY